MDMSNRKLSIPPSKRVYLKAALQRKANISSLPNEILLRIFAHLEPNELASVACVCRQWLELSKDNLIWRTVYERYVRKGSDIPNEMPASYWRTQCIKCGIERRNKKIFHLLNKQNHYTKLPSQIHACLTKADIRWQLTFLDTDDREHPFLHNDHFHFQTSMSVRWFSLDFPPLRKIKRMRLHSLNPVFYVKSGHVHKNSVCQRSLLVERDIQWRQLPSREGTVESGPLICHVVADSFLVALWKDGGEIAFISACLHYNKLVERCLLGSSDRQYEIPAHKPYKDDIDPKFGLHGYSCIVELRNQRNRLWTDGFASLFSRQPPDMGVHLTLIKPSERAYHQVIRKPLTLPWKTDLFKGVVTNCCVLDVTVIDGEGQQIWCSSGLVIVRPMNEVKTDFEFDGQDVVIHHQNDNGEVYLKMNKDESKNVHSITSLFVKLHSKTVNEWFGTKY